MLQLLLATAMRSAEPFQRASGAVPPRARVAPLRALDSFMLGRLDEMRVTFEEMTARLARRPRGDAVEAFDATKGSGARRAQMHFERSGPKIS